MPTCIPHACFVHADIQMVHLQAWQYYKMLTVAAGRLALALVPAAGPTAAS